MNYAQLRSRTTDEVASGLQLSHSTLQLAIFWIVREDGSPLTTGLWAVMGHGLHSPSVCRLPLSQITGNLVLGDKRLGGQSCSRA